MRLANYIDRSDPVISRRELELSDEDRYFGGSVPSSDNRTDIDPENLKTMKKLNRIAGWGQTGKRDKLIMGQMKARMAALWRDGVRYNEIIETINEEFDLNEESGSRPLTVKALGQHIESMLRYWREKSLGHVDEKQAIVLARYDQIEQLATEAYFASCQGQETKSYDKQLVRARTKARYEDIRDNVMEDREAAVYPNMPKAERLVRPNNQGEVMGIMQDTAEKIKTQHKHRLNPAGDPRWVTIMVDINYKRSQLWQLLNNKEAPNSDQELAKLSDEQRTEKIASLIAQARNRALGNLGNLAPASPLGGFVEGEMPQAHEKADPPAPTMTLVPLKTVEEELDGLEWD